MLQKLNFRPGINRENTNYATEGGWWDMDKVRFRYGSPQKIGGWKRAASGTFSGTARNITCWASLQGEVIIGIGTNQRYYISHGGAYYNITPLRKTETLAANPFVTTINSSVVRVTAASHGAIAGDHVSFANATAVGGISADVFNREEGFRIQAVIDGNTLSIDTESTASSSTQGGDANVFASYEVSSGLSVFTSGAGWGAGIWNGPLTGTETTLSGTGQEGLSSIDTTINVASTTGFSSSGTLVIEAEVITYTGLTSTSFTGCTRGTSESTAAQHNRRQLTATTFAPLYVKQVIGLVGENEYGQGVNASFGIGSSQLRLWTAANYGEDLIMCPRGGGIYYWNRDLTTFARAAALRDETDISTSVGPHDPDDPNMRFVPHTVNAVIVSDVSRFVIALGANPYDPDDDGTDFDPMLIRWSEQDRPDIWAPHTENQSGEQRLSAGSYIMNGVNMKQEMLIWTDAALYSMQYIGPPYVWNIQLSMGNLSLMGPNAISVVNNNVFWMGCDKFYVYNGRVDTLQCSVSQYVFDDLSFSQRFQTFAGTNEGFNEIWWFYVSNTEVTNATHEGRDPTIDKYVVYNHAEQCWYYGAMNRTAWLDTPLYPGPLATTNDENGDGVMVMHEQGTDDGTADTLLPISSYIQSSDFDIGDGHQFLFVWRVLPDVSFNGSDVPNPQVTITLLPRQNPGVDYASGDPTAVQSAQAYSPVLKQYTVQQFTPQVNTRVRGRAMALRIESDQIGVQWKLGVPRIDARPDGRKS